MRLLLVDDDHVFRELLALLLERANDQFEVVGKAANGAEAVGLAAAVSPDVVIMDVDLPLLDGIEAARLIREREPEVRILLVSGSSFAERGQEAHQALQAGALGYLPKSRVAEDLIDAILALDFGAKQPVAG